MDKILEVKNLKLNFNTDDCVIKAVDGISFSVNRSEVLGIVGESGSGKSVTVMSLMGLIDTPPGEFIDGEILFQGRDVLKMTAKELTAIRGGKVSMIFQDPMTSLNPYLKISTQLVETIMLHQNLKKTPALARAIEMLELVGISDAKTKVHHYPHQFSGGMRQRVMIAMALSCQPELLIADEPTTALDVTIQAQILELIKKLTKKLNTSVILISHDLGVISGMCDSVCIMYAGRIVEKGDVYSIYENPQHPYTKGLLASIPRIDKDRKEKLYTIKGQPPIITSDMPPSCAFYKRCENVMDICKNSTPELKEIGKERYCACFLYN